MTSQNRSDQQQQGMDAAVEEPSIPNKRYFTIGEVGQLCSVKSHVLRYWEQEFTQLKPIKRRGNRRYYQRHDIELIRLIRTLLYEQGFTIAGARQQLSNLPRGNTRDPSALLEAITQMHRKLKSDSGALLESATTSAEPTVKTARANDQALDEIAQQLRNIQQRLAPFRRRS